MSLTSEQKALVQRVVAYASIIMGVLTTQLSGIKLPVWGSVILGVFGVLLHPETSITQSAPTTSVTTASGDVLKAPVAPVAIVPQTVPTLAPPHVAP